MSTRLPASGPLTRGLLVVTASIAIVGCGLNDPYRAPTTSTTATAPRVIDNEVQPARPHVDRSRPTAAPAPTAPIAVERFAVLYINWTYRTLADHRRRLARMAVGEASASQRRAVAQTAGDYELRAGKVENHGTIVAITAARGHVPHRYVVVTRERTTGPDTYDGLPAAYHVTLATVRPVDHGWAVSQWQPQN